MKAKGAVGELLERSPFISAIVDAEGTIALASGALEKLLGREPRVLSDLKELFGDGSSWRSVRDHIWNAEGEWLVAPLRDSTGTAHPASWRSDPLSGGNVLLSAMVYTAGKGGDVPVFGLTEYMAGAADRERARVAAFLHDRLGQELTGLKMLTASLRRKISQGDDGTEAGDLADELAELAAGCLSQIRELSHSLMSVDFRRTTLERALEQLVESMTTSEVEVGLTFERLPSSISPGKARATFGIIREALTNALRHSGAERVEVRVWALDGDLNAEVRDGGRGFDADGLTEDAACGLLLMRERALAQGMELRVRSDEGMGTVVSCMVPGAFGGCGEDRAE